MGTRDWRDDNPSKFYNRKRKHELMKQYGITPMEYDDMLERQEYLCAICSTDTPGHKGMFMVDHCHGTGVVRGLLCNTCNSGLGMFKDNVELLAKAIEYLNKDRS